jgi:acyl-CoA dehydrogenase
MLNFTLTKEQMGIKDKARAFALREVLPHAWKYDEKDETPVFILKKAFEEGLINSDIPEEYGGKGYGIIEEVIMTEEIAAACPGLATSIFDNSLGMAPIILSDNKGIKEKYLPQIAKEFKLICFTTSEPTMGSDVSGIRCQAKSQGDDFVLTGTKYWITNGGIADYITVFATIDPKLSHKGIGAFLVEKNGRA